MSVDQLLADGQSIAEIVLAIAGALNVAILIQGRLARREAQRETAEMRRVVGEPSPHRATLTEGTTLTEKLERLSDGMGSLQEAFKTHVDKERAREIARELSEQPRRGRRAAYDYPGDDERGTGTQEDVAGP